MSPLLTCCCLFFVTMKTISSDAALNTISTSLTKENDQISLKPCSLPPAPGMEIEDDPYATELDPTVFKCENITKAIMLEKHNGLFVRHFDIQLEHKCQPESGWEVHSSEMRQLRQQYICADSTLNCIDLSQWSGVNVTRSQQGAIFLTCASRDATSEPNYTLLYCLHGRLIGSLPSCAKRRFFTSPTTATTTTTATSATTATTVQLPSTLIKFVTRSINSALTSKNAQPLPADLEQADTERLKVYTSQEDNKYSWQTIREWTPTIVASLICIGCATIILFVFLCYYWLRNCHFMKAHKIKHPTITENIKTHKLPSITRQWSKQSTQAILSDEHNDVAHIPIKAV